MNKMWERVKKGRLASPAAYFAALTYSCEFLTKITVLGFVSAVQDEKDRLRYQQLHKLVRSDGLGGWLKVLNTVLTGPPAQYLLPEARSEQVQMTRHQGPGTWQYSAVEEMHKALKVVHPDCDELPPRRALTQWFQLFSQLRNRTRGHGAISMDVHQDITPSLDNALSLVTENFSLLCREWVYLHRNLSGKYRIARLSKTSDNFAFLKKNPGEYYADGVYVYFGRPVPIELTESLVDGSDFFIANGAFRAKQYELLSYLTGETKRVDGTKYLRPPGKLPQSETQGRGELDVQGNCFGNVPAPSSDYVERVPLEQDLLACLRDDRHPIITLVGRGGIGKTSLALAVIHRLQMEERFGYMIWFSARDIDLLPEGPKQVRPHVLDVGDIASEYARLIGPTRTKTKKFNAVELLGDHMSQSPDDPILFVFDNFETVSDPSELYLWIDTYVRCPNKVLVTTRFRDFRGDYPIDVKGMNEAECTQLINKTAARFGVRPLLTSQYREAVFRESDGHPYVVKVLLGEVAKAKRTVSVKRIMASREDILTALFERTFASLSPVAKRVYLTLCKWNTTLPELVLKAVFLREENERMDVDEALIELERSCFIERVESIEDRQEFVSVPLSAAIFGKSKLAVSPFKAAVEADAALLQEFGAALQCNVRHGIAPQVRRFVAFVSRESMENPKVFDLYRPILEFIAIRFPPAWLHIATLYEESELDNSYELAKDAVRQFLERADELDCLPAWERLRDLCRQTKDFAGEVHALVELSSLPTTPYWKVSSSANRATSLFREHPIAMEQRAQHVLAERLVNIMEKRISEAIALDYSRLAWLCIHLHDEGRACRHVNRGLELEPENEHLQRLKTRLFG